jgi:hypothetical protein
MFYRLTFNKKSYKRIGIKEKDKYWIRKRKKVKILKTEKLSKRNDSTT